MRADVVIAWDFATVPTAIRSKFQRPTQFISIPTPPSRTYFAQVNSFGWGAPVRGIINKYAPGLEPLRVACLGFSESCHGVRNLLGSGDGGRFDAAIAIDGVHTPFVNGKQVDPNTMMPWFEFGKRAILNDTLLVTTNSSIVPPTFASTTQTAEWLWKTLTGDIAPFQDPLVPPMSAAPRTINGVEYSQLPPHVYRRARGLVELGFENLDKKGGGKADHIYQAKTVLPLVIEHMLAARWNAIDPDDTKAGCYVSGTPAALGSPCAQSVVLPASYMKSTDSAFIVKGSAPGQGPDPVQPEPPAGQTSTSIQKRDDTVVKVVVGTIGAGILYYALQ